MTIITRLTENADGAVLCYARFDEAVEEETGLHGTVRVNKRQDQPFKMYGELELEGVIDEDDFFRTTAVRRLALWSSNIVIGGERAILSVAGPRRGYTIGLDKTDYARAAPLSMTFTPQTEAHTDKKEGFFDQHVTANIYVSATKGKDIYLWLELTVPPALPGPIERLEFRSPVLEGYSGFERQGDNILYRAISPVTTWHLTVRFVNASHGQWSNIELRDFWVSPWLGKAREVWGKAGIFINPGLPAAVVSPSPNIFLQTQVADCASAAIWDEATYLASALTVYLVSHLPDDCQAGLSAPSGPYIILEASNRTRVKSPGQPGFSNNPYLLAHELAHILGLEHPADPGQCQRWNGSLNSIMTPSPAIDQPNPAHNTLNNIYGVLSNPLLGHLSANILTKQPDQPFVWQPDPLEALDWHVWLSTLPLHPDYQECGVTAERNYDSPVPALVSPNPDADHIGQFDAGQNCYVCFRLHQFQLRPDDAPTWVRLYLAKDDGAGLIRLDPQLASFERIHLAFSHAGDVGGALLRSLITPHWPAPSDQDINKLLNRWIRTRSVKMNWNVALLNVLALTGFHLFAVVDNARSHAALQLDAAEPDYNILNGWSQNPDPERQIYVKKVAFSVNPAPPPG